ncbi:hypothetical protein Tco_0610186 [Tanacetum coccineum]
MSNSPTVSPFLKECVVYILYTNAKMFADDVLLNHVGDNELKSIDAVGTGRMTKKEIKKDDKGTRTESGFKRAFATLFGQDVETFTGTMFLNMDQLEKQLDNEEFQEIGSMAAFKKSIVEREQHKREYDNRVNERQMQTTEEKVNTSKALDASLVDTESSRT